MHTFMRTSFRDDTSSTDEHNLIPAKVPRQKLRSGKLRAFTGVSEKQISQTNISRRRMTQDGGRGGTDTPLLDTNTQLKKRHLHELLQKKTLIRDLILPVTKTQGEKCLTCNEKRRRRKFN